MKKCILTLMALTIVGAIIANSRLLSVTSFFTNEIESEEPTSVATSPALAAEDETVDSIAAAIVTSSDVDLTFTNDETYPWTVEDGYVQSSNYKQANSVSKFSTTFTVTKPSKFSFTSSTYYYENNNSPSSSYYSYHYFDFKINGERYMGRNYGAGTTCLMLEPGEYTMEWRDTIYNSSYNFKSQVSNIELSSKWIDVELSTPGTLGVEVLYKVNVLNDVELLKVKGTLNETDWTNIKQMNNLIGVDLTEARFDAIPAYAFNGLSKLSNVKLPEGMTSIGEFAFKGTQILGIDIPSSVKTIGQFAFAGTRIRKVSFKENSQLTSLGGAAFYKCTSLKSIELPNSVTSVGSSAFEGCSSLKSIHFSDAMLTIDDYTCYGCTSLESLHLPTNLKTIGYSSFYDTENLRKVDIPSSVNRINEYAFYNCGIDSLALPVTLSYLCRYAFSECQNLKYIELPSYLERGSSSQPYRYVSGGSSITNSTTTMYYGYTYNFKESPSIETVVCRSATPPSITNDPFYNARSKSAITLKVPSFAVVNYKLDTYWYQFGSIVEGDDIDYWKITSELSLTNNRRMNGKPDIDLYYGGKLRVGGNAPMPTADFNYYVSEGNPGCLINDCPDMTAENLSTKFSVSANSWYFLTPVHDVVLNQVTHSANASYVFRYYDGASRGTNGTGSSWKNVEDGGTLKAGQGYIFQCNAAGVITLPAEAAVHEQLFNTEDVTTPLYTYESTAAANKSWNYVGNPFPAYFDVYYMDFTAPITVWTGSTYKAYSIVDDEFVLRPMQSFFVQKPEEVENIVFHKEGRQFSSAIERASYAPARSGQPAGNRLLFNLQIVNSENAADETRVVINEAAKMSYEISSDASKFTSMEKGVPQLFTIDDEGNRYAINERPLYDGHVQMGFYAPESGYYTIQALRADGEVTLYDTALGKSIDITSEAYTFHSEAGNDVSRFVLIFNASLLEPTAIDHASIDEVNVSTLPGQIVVNAAEGTSIAVYNIGGEIIYEGTLNSPSLTIDTPTGAYIVKAGNRSYKTVISQ